MPRFYPNVITLQPGKAVVPEQRETIDLLVKSNLPGRWSVKDSFRTLDLSRLTAELGEAASRAPRQPQPRTRLVEVP